MMLTHWLRTLNFSRTGNSPRSPQVVVPRKTLRGRRINRMPAQVELLEDRTLLSLLIRYSFSTATNTGALEIETNETQNKRMERNG